MKTRLMIGTQRATLAANGVDLQFGSPLDILGDTAMFGAIDEQRIQANAAREAWGYRTEAMNYRAQGAMASYNGNASAMGSYLGAAASAFQSASSIAGSMKGPPMKTLGSTSPYKGGSTYKSVGFTSGAGLKPYGG